MAPLWTVRALRFNARLLLFTTGALALATEIKGEHNAVMISALIATAGAIPAALWLKQANRLEAEAKRS